MVDCSELKLRFEQGDLHWPAVALQSLEAASPGKALEWATSIFLKVLSYPEFATNGELQKARLELVGAIEVKNYILWKSKSEHMWNKNQLYKALSNLYAAFYFFGISNSKMYRWHIEAAVWLLGTHEVFADNFTTIMADVCSECNCN